MHNSNANPFYCSLILRFGLSTIMLLACTATMAGQEIDRASGADLFSPPLVGSSAGTAPPTDGLLDTTTNLFSSSEPAASDAVAEPTTAATPSLISTPEPVQPTPTSQDNDSWGTTGSYQHAASLWGSPIEQPADSYPVVTGDDASMAYPQMGSDCQAPVYGEPVDCAAPSCDMDCCCLSAGGNQNCGSLCGCGPSTWARFDVLLWNMDGYGTPALITRAPGNVVQNGAGALSGDGTRVLFGNQELGDDLRIGGRFQFGRWFDDCRRFGIQTDFFGLGGGSQSAVFTGNGDDIFARPFFNTDPNVNAQDAQVFAMPGVAEGSVRFDTSSEVWSAGPSLRFNLCCSGNDPCNPSSSSRRVDFLLGYRFFRLEESFSSQEILRPTDPAYVDGTSFELNDRIRTRNDFHGVEIGLNHLSQRGRWMWDVSAICALGEVERVVDLNGTTRINVPGFSDETFPGGFFVGPQDIGRFRDNDFAAIPQVRANLSYCVCNNLRLSVGYNFVYVSSAFRPGQFLNTQIDGTRLGQNRPISSVRTPSFRRDDMFLHGANVGLTYNF